MQRRQYLVAIGALGLGAIAGCTEESGDGSSGQDTTDAQNTGAPTTGAPTEEPTTEGSETDAPTTDDSGSAASVYQVRVQYDGEWTGSVGGDGSSRSVDGSGTQTFSIEGDPLFVSANAQKQGDGSGELTIQILEDGDVIAEQSTSAEYGVAQVTSQGGTSGGSGTEGASGSGTAFSVRVQYSGSWQGAVGTGGSTRSVEGTGSETIQLEGSPDIISANAQKQDDSSDELTIQILKDGAVVEETSTSAAYGVAQASYSNF